MLFSSRFERFRGRRRNSLQPAHKKSSLGPGEREDSCCYELDTLVKLITSALPCTMASSLAAQLSQVAAKATHQFDLKAQRSAHAQSLIFEKKVASTQDFDTIYQLYYEGFQELCALDPRFQPFRQNLFSEQSKVEDRSQMTAAQNKELDVVIEDFLALVGGRLLLNPAVKAVDWLVRRFRYVNTPRRVGSWSNRLLTDISFYIGYTNTTPVLLFLHSYRTIPRHYSSTFYPSCRRT